MRRVVPVLMVGVACADTGDLATWVRDVTVIAVVAEPPEVTPGDTLTLSVTVGDPAARGVDLLVWSCTDLGDGCVEALPPHRPLSAWARVARDVGPTASMSFLVPPVLPGDLGGSASTVTFLIWALACAPGLCDVMDDVAATPAPESAAWEATVEALARPDDWLVGLPIAGTSLAVRRAVLSVRPIQQRNLNPSVEYLGPEPLEARVGEVVDLRFGTEDAVRARPFTTLGVFDDATVAVTTGGFVASWWAPATPGTATLWVSVDDGLGGYAVWSRVVEVR